MNQPLLTRHGVRNLNGPQMDGRKHNGRRASCAHYKSPDLPTYPLESLQLIKRTDPDTGLSHTQEKLVRGHYCSMCDELRFTDAED